MSATYHKHEPEKCHAYEERVHVVEHGCFTLFSTSGRMGEAATVFYKRLANLLPYPS